MILTSSPSSSLAIVLGPTLFGGRLRRFERLACGGGGSPRRPRRSSSSRCRTDAPAPTSSVAHRGAVALVRAAPRVRAGQPARGAGCRSCWSGSPERAVIVANGGMPVSAHALHRLGPGRTCSQLLNDEGADKHHLMTDDDVLTPLADVIADPAADRSGRERRRRVRLVGARLVDRRGYARTDSVGGPGGDGDRTAGSIGRGARPGRRLRLTWTFRLLEPRRREPAP